MNKQFKLVFHKKGCFDQYYIYFTQLICQIRKKLLLQTTLLSCPQIEVKYLRMHLVPTAHLRKTHLNYTETPLYQILRNVLEDNPRSYCSTKLYSNQYKHTVQLLRTASSWNIKILQLFQYKVLRNIQNFTIIVCNTKWSQKGSSAVRNKKLQPKIWS